MSDVPSPDRADELRAKLIRNFDDAPLQRELREPLYDTACARLARGTAAKQLGLSVDVLAPGKRGCPYHAHHAEEEMFIVISGEGTLRVAGEMLAIRAGDVIFIPATPELPHQIINTSAAPLKFLSVSTQSALEIVEYPDSGKVLVGSDHGYDRMQRAGPSLDYWDGEP